LKSTF